TLRITIAAIVSLPLLFTIWRAKAVSPPQSKAAVKQDHASFVGARVLVKFRTGADGERKDRVLRVFGGRIAEEMPSTGVHIIRLPGGVAEEKVMQALSSNPVVEFAELDRYVAPERIPNDPYYPSEWHLAKIQAPSAWDVTIGNSGLIVAVLDSGVDQTHPDLASKLIPGWNFYNNNSDTSDVNGHGTAVAGTLAAWGDNGVGIASLAWNCQLMPIRIADASAYATYSAAANALTWAADHGARVANLSYAMTGSSTVTSAAQYFRSKGGIVTVAA